VTPRARSSLLLGGTLVIGMLLGALIVGAVGQWRAGRAEGLRHEEAFTRHMVTLIQPRDEAQRDAVRQIVRATAARNTEIAVEFRESMRSALQAMVEELAPLLDEEQLDRLQRFAASPPPAGPRGGPGGPPPRRPR